MLYITLSDILYCHLHTEMYAFCVTCYFAAVHMVFENQVHTLSSSASSAAGIAAPHVVAESPFLVAPAQT